ncbi:MAG: dimethylarginine dimethylaminohydrolase family protein [Vicinamibacteria bacterium]
MLWNEGDRLTRVVVSSPLLEYFAVADPRAHNMNQAAEPAKTQAQHHQLVDAMARAGAEVIDAPELTGHPNSVFTRDVALATPRGYVELRMGLPTRRGEESWMVAILEEGGEPRAGKIEPPGTVEGGDVILSGKVAFVGHSERTNADGVRQLSEILRPMGYEVRVAPVTGHLHIGGAMSAIAPERVVACRADYPAGFFDGFDVVWIDERGPSCGNVICLGPNEVLASEAENLETMEVLDRNGVAVRGLDLSEFRKGSGGPTCLILPLERA